MAEIPDADSINHVVVFLTGVQPFPNGTGGSGSFLTFTFDRFLIYGIHVLRIRFPIFVER